jgi:hypothetical protein
VKSAHVLDAGQELEEKEITLESCLSSSSTCLFFNLKKKVRAKLIIYLFLFVGFRFPRGLLLSYSGSFAINLHGVYSAAQHSIGLLRCVT